MEKMIDVIICIEEKWAMESFLECSSSAWALPKFEESVELGIFPNPG